jgi:hypothetical protein
LKCSGVVIRVQGWLSAAVTRRLKAASVMSGCALIAASSQARSGFTFEGRRPPVPVNRLGVSAPIGAPTTRFSFVLRGRSLTLIHSQQIIQKDRANVVNQEFYSGVIRLVKSMPNF